MDQAFTGVINPYALAELVVGRAIRWDSLSNRDETLANILRTPADAIFDLRKSPILNSRLQVTAAGKLKTVSAADSQKSIQDHWTKTRFTALRSAPFRRVAPKNVVETLEALADAPANAKGEWNPKGKEWYDKGDFFEDLSEFNDPIQGALGDCYFIAALSSVAWARPYTIVNMVRPSSWGDEDNPVHRVEFYKDGTGAAQPVEVTERIPVVAGSKNWVYARSLDTNETWPAIMEKAYAKWRTGNATDAPDYNPIAGGDPVMACAQLVRGARSYKANPSQTAAGIYSYVRSNSLSRRTVNPMVAWTYSTPPAGVNYTTANVVANHAYSVLGWDYRNSTMYVVLRNPWGTKHATLDTLSGTWSAYETSFWAPIPLNVNGVFAMKAATFKKYFAGIGHVA